MKYVLVYKGGNLPTSANARIPLMQAWRRWVGGLGSAAIDAGNPFGSSARLASEGSASGGGSSELKGYVIFSAESLAAATAIARGCPHLTIAGGAVEIYETLPID